MRSPTGIISQVITPRFRSGDFAGGIEAGIDTMFKVTKGEMLPERSRAGGRNACARLVPNNGLHDHRHTCSISLA